MGLREQVEKLRELLEREKPEVLSVEEVAVMLDVSPTTARGIMKAYALVYSDTATYKRGKLYLTWR